MIRTGPIERSGGIAGPRSHSSTTSYTRSSITLFKRFFQGTNCESVAARRGERWPVRQPVPGATEEDTTATAGFAAAVVSDDPHE